MLGLFVFLVAIFSGLGLNDVHQMDQNRRIEEDRDSHRLEDVFSDEQKREDQEAKVSSKKKCKRILREFCGELTSKPLIAVGYLSSFSTLMSYIGMI